MSREWKNVCDEWKIRVADTPSAMKEKYTNTNIYIYIDYTLSHKRA